MGLANRVAVSKSNDGEQITITEIDFILSKLRTATFKGEEFETFYNVWVKLSNIKSELQKK